MLGLLSPPTSRRCVQSGLKGCRMNLSAEALGRRLKSSLHCILGLLSLPTSDLVRFRLHTWPTVCAYLCPSNVQTAYLVYCLHRTQVTVLAEIFRCPLPVHALSSIAPCCSYNLRIHLHEPASLQVKAYAHSFRLAGYFCHRIYYTW